MTEDEKKFHRKNMKTAIYVFIILISCFILLELRNDKSFLVRNIVYSNEILRDFYNYSILKQTKFNTNDACYSKMCTIQGAVELFFMEYKSKEPPNVSLKKLLVNNYLSKIPSCPFGVRYSIREYYDKHNSYRYIIHCTVHGDQEDKILTDR